MSVLKLWGFCKPRYFFFSFNQKKDSFLSIFFKLISLWPSCSHHFCPRRTFTGPPLIQPYHSVVVGQSRHRLLSAYMLQRRQRDSSPCLGKEVSGHPRGLRMSKSGDMATRAGAPCVTLPPTEDQEEERPLRPVGRRGAWRCSHPDPRTPSALCCSGGMFGIPHCVFVLKRGKREESIYFFPFFSPLPSSCFAPPRSTAF